MVLPTVDASETANWNTGWRNLGTNSFSPSTRIASRASECSSESGFLARTVRTKEETDS